MKKAGYYVLLALGVGVAGYFTIQNVLPQDEEVVMYGEVDEARTKRASLQSMSCSATNAGTLRYSNGCFQYCDGKGAWINKGAGCDASSHTISCIGLPVANASWNTTSSITQTRNGDEWLPTAIGSYNITGSNSECRFKCKENYTYNGGNNTCVVNTKSNQSCTGLVANAEWNTVSSITQTWSGNTWTPTTTGSYNTEISTSECRFKCKTNYTRNNGSKMCVANTKPNQSCTGLPVVNAEWNTVSSITQTWSGNTWTPTTTGSYNTETSTSECRFKCKTNYTRNSDSKTCVASTKSNQSCTGKPAGAIWNTASSITQTWNGNAWTPTTMGSYNTETSTSECRFKCDTSASYLRNGYSCQASTYPGCNANDISVWDYLIAACNVGSDTAGTSSSSYGNYYQRGNNYGFSASDLIGGTVTREYCPLYRTNTTSSPSSYNSSTYYHCSSGTPDSWVRNNAPWETAIAVQNMWWWYINTNSAKQWPCAAGYHVPTSEEWDAVMVQWGSSRYWWGVESNYPDPYHYTNDARFASYLKLPYAGIIGKGHAWNVGSAGYYLTSTRTSGFWGCGGLRMFSSSFSAGLSSWISECRDAASVRCFKNM